MISKKLIRRYQEEYKSKTGKEISGKNAERELCDLATLIRMIAKERRNRHGK